MSRARATWANAHLSLKGVAGLLLQDQWQHGEMEQILASWYQLPPGSHALAENVLLEQFVEGVDGAVYKISLASGESEAVCAKVSQLRAVLEGPDGQRLLAQSLRADWEKDTGRTLTEAQRLVPTIPVAGGGKLESVNLHAVIRDEAIDYLHSIHVQTQSQPDRDTARPRRTR